MKVDSEKKCFAWKVSATDGSPAAVEAGLKKVYFMFFLLRSKLLLCGCTWSNTTALKSKHKLEMVRLDVPGFFSGYKRPIDHRSLI